MCKLLRRWASALLAFISQALIFFLRQDFFRPAFWEILPFESAAVYHITQIFWQGHPNAHQAVACAYSALALGAAVAQLQVRMGACLFSATPIHSEFSSPNMSLALQSRCDAAVIISFVGFAAAIAVRTVGPVLISDKPAK